MFKFITKPKLFIKGLELTPSIDIHKIHIYFFNGQHLEIRFTNEKARDLYFEGMME